MVSKENKKTIIEMRKANKSYDYIASQLGLTKSAVQNVCRQAGLAGKKAKQRKRCKQCGALLPGMLPKERFSVVRNAVKTGGTSISIWSINEIQSSPTAKLVAVPSRITRAIRSNIAIPIASTWANSVATKP